MQFWCFDMLKLWFVKFWNYVFWYLELLMFYYCLLIFELFLKLWVVGVWNFEFWDLHLTKMKKYICWRFIVLFKRTVFFWTCSICHFEMSGKLNIWNFEFWYIDILKIVLLLLLVNLIFDMLTMWQFKFETVENT